ncbi:MAG: regulatory protein RecX [Clostridia bacterium]|nr:regulatory protein RecX [Clostridia bacterium]
MKFINAKDLPQKEDLEAEDVLKETPQPKSRRERKERTKKEPPSAQTAALRLISMRDHSSRQLREKLSERGYSPEEIEETLDFLREKRFLDDLRYGRNLIRYMAERRYFGAYKIRMELLQKLDRKYIDELLPDELENYDFAVLARELVEKPQLRGKSREALIRKLKANGYGVSEIRYALADVTREKD